MAPPYIPAIEVELAIQVLFGDPNEANSTAAAARGLLLHGGYSERGRSGDVAIRARKADEVGRWPDSEDA